MHRTPWVLIISAIVILVVIMAGAGIAIGVLSHRGTASQNTSGILPSPSPAGTPSPTSPPSTTGSSSASNSGESFTLPAGWTVRNNDEQTIVVTNPNGDGAVYIQSRALGTAQTAQQNKDNTDKYFQSQAPDTKTCPGSATTTGTLNGPSGIFWELCFTLTAGGQSFPARAALFAGANADGSVSYLVYLVTSDANMKSFIAEATPVLNSIHWKLT